MAEQPSLSATEQASGTGDAAKARGAAVGGPDDAELLRRYHDVGDREAMNALFTRHLDCAYRLALRCTRNAADAEDAVQAACVEFLRRAGEFRGEGTVRAYFMGFVVSFSRHKNREEARRSAREAGVEAREDSGDGLASAESREQRALVLGAIKDLPEHYRLPLWLHFVEGWSAVEVAHSLQVSDKTVRTQLSRGIEELKRALGVAEATAAALPGLLAVGPLEAAPSALLASVSALTLKSAAATTGAAAAGKVAVAGKGSGSAAVLLLGGTAMKITAVAVLATAAATSAVVLSHKGDTAETAKPAVVRPEEKAPAGPEKPKGDPQAPLGSPAYNPSADRPVGWRGDGTGRFPAATPPLEWYRRPKGAYSAIRVLATKPKGSGPEGELLNMGFVRDWLVAGPFEAKSPETALEDVTQPNETELAPAAGESLAGKAWKAIPASVGNQSQSWNRLTLDLALAFGQESKQEWQNHPGSMDPQVAYAVSYLYSPEACKVRVKVEGSKVKAWLNGNAVKIPGQYEASPVLDLNAGWNRLNLKMASTKRNWNASAVVVPAAGVTYETKNIVWMAAMPGYSWSSPIVVGSKIFINADAGTLLCLNKEDGRVLWARTTSYYHAIPDEERKAFPDLAAKAEQLDKISESLPADLNAALSVDGSKADGNEALSKKIKQKHDLENSILGTMDKAGKAYAYWGNDRCTTTPTPVSDGTNVYVAFFGGNKGRGAHVIACYDLDGKNLWTRFTGQTGIAEHGSHATPTLSGNHLVFASGRMLFGYEKTTGKLDWQKTGLDQGCCGASLLTFKAGGVDAVIVPESGIFRSSDGEELWKTDVKSSILTPSLVDGVLYGISESNNSSSFYALKVGDGGKPTSLVKAPWKGIGLNLSGTFTNSLIGSPLYDNGLYYVATEGAGLTVVDAKAGKAVYTKALESLCPRLTWVFVVGICSGPNLSGKYIHIRDDQGQTLVIEPGSQYKELARNMLWELNANGGQQESQSNPYYEGGRMYYRSGGFLYCIGEK
ncbi:MAG: sigma-70 family RNA polymerase sigma factor [Planctomycetes bacterium]|nr:sigma-70 family RNA polymerase sigma factor [Planctomycetota bacterium]